LSTVNLCARVFLIGKDGAKVSKELDIAYRDGDLKNIGELWRKRAAIGRLHCHTYKAASLFSFALFKGIL
jgi:hypothetical protein